jgi:hypothetical protein
MQPPRKDEAGAAEIVTVTICVLAVILAVVLQTYQICCRP